MAQLHQLRGPRHCGRAASSCVLLYRNPLSQIARARLEVMRETGDGFRIAEKDLELRGRVNCSVHARPPVAIPRRRLRHGMRICCRMCSGIGETLLRE